MVENVEAEAEAEAGAISPHMMTQQRFSPAPTPNGAFRDHLRRLWP